MVAVLACSVLTALRWLIRPGGTTAASGDRQAAVLALREDGALSRWTGRVVQGNLMPLPGAIAGLVLTGLLAGSGMSNTIGIVKLAPPVVMLLAAPGSAHRHDGKLDWLAPVLLQAAQFVYLVALGASCRVPWPVIFVVCALTALRGASLAADAAVGSPAAATRAGWEGRMLAAGLGAMLGLAPASFVLLAAYLGVLVVGRIASGYLMPLREAAR
jgi:hypothetical protein